MSFSPLTYYQVQRSISFISSLKKKRKDTGRKGRLGKEPSGAPETQERGFPFPLKESVFKHDALSPCLRGSRAEDRRGRPALLLPARPGRLPFPVLAREAHAPRPFPRRAEGGSAVSLSSSPPLAGPLTGSDSAAGHRARLSRPLPVRGLRGPRPRWFVFVPTEGKKRKKSHKLPLEAAR